MVNYENKLEEHAVDNVWDNAVKHAVDNVWDTTNNQVKSSLVDENNISVQEHAERFATAPKMIKDAFILQDDGSFLVKQPKDSKVMDWHLKNLPIVPGVVLKRLFFHQTNSDEKGIVTTQFIWWAYSWQSIVVKRDGIYTPTGKRMVDITINTQEEIISPKSDNEIMYQNQDINPNDYLLQQNAFRFFDEGQKDWIMQNWTHFRWSFIISEDCIGKEMDENISHVMIEEIAAQTAACLTGPELNEDIPMIINNNTEDTDDKTEINSNAKLFTYKVGKNLSTKIPLKIGDTVYVEWKVITFSPKGKEAHFCYIAKNQNDEILMTGEIKGHIVWFAVLQRLYNNIINNA